MGHYLQLHHLTFICLRNAIAQMDPVYGLITSICVIAAAFAVFLALAQPRHRAAFCFTALGVLLAIPVAHSFGSGEQRMQPSTKASVQKLASGEAVLGSLDQEGTAAPKTSASPGYPQEEGTQSVRRFALGESRARKAV